MEVVSSRIGNNDNKTSLAIGGAAAAAAAVLVYRNRQKVSKYLGEDLPLYILTNHRSAVVTIFGLPLSLIFDTVFRVRSKYTTLFYSAPHLHDERVRTIQQKVEDRHDKDAPLCTARPGWMSISLSYRTYL